MNAKKEKSPKRSLAIVAVLLVLLMAIGGTVAWLTSTSELDNKFTVGLIKPVDPQKPGPGGETIPEEDKKPDAGKLSGNLYEPNWVKDSKLLPGAEIKKDPYVGVGPGSEKSYVYIYVTNSMKNNEHIYFTINKGWEAVANQTTVVTGDTAGEPDAKYTGGLFKYTAGLDGSKDTVNNTWTTQPLFSNVVVDDAANMADFVLSTVERPELNGNDELGTIKVQSFVHQYFDADGKTQLDEATVVLPAVKKAFGLS